MGTTLEKHLISIWGSLGICVWKSPCCMILRGSVWDWPETGIGDPLICLTLELSYVAEEAGHRMDKCTCGAEYARILWGQIVVLFWHLFWWLSGPCIALIYLVLGCHQGPISVTVRSVPGSSLTAEELFYVPDLGHMLLLTLICHFSSYLHRFPRSSYHLAPIA